MDLSGLPPGARATVVRNLTSQVDAVAVAAFSVLAGAGVDAILLKGASFGRWLYEPTEPRSYGDVDVLVSQSVFSTAESALAAGGFGRRGLSTEGQESGWKHVTWIHLKTGIVLELHRTIFGPESDPDVVWETLSRRTEALEMEGRSVPVLTPSARLMHVAVHVAQHGSQQER